MYIYNLILYSQDTRLELLISSSYLTKVRNIKRFTSKNISPFFYKIYIETLKIFLILKFIHFLTTMLYILSNFYILYMHTFLVL